MLQMRWSTILQVTSSKWVIGHTQGLGNLDTRWNTFYSNRLIARLFNSMYVHCITESKNYFCREHQSR